MAICPNNQVHPLLTELELPLPLGAETSWTFTRGIDGQCVSEELRITLGPGGDLILEIRKNAREAGRYVFNESGCLVSMYQPNPENEPLFQAVQASVLQIIRNFCYSNTEADGRLNR